MSDPWIVEFSNTKTQNPEKLIEALNNMKSHHADTQIQKAIFMVVIGFFETKEHKDKLLSVFKQLDTNGDGVLSKNELMNGKFLGIL